MHKHLPQMLALGLLVAGLGAAAQQHPERRGIGTLPLPAVKSVAKATPEAVAPPIDERRSIFVTDQAIVKEFSFADVMDAIVASSGDRNMTKERLFSQWWDTANRAPGLGLGSNCDAEKDAAGNATLNGSARSGVLNRRNF